ncbi:MAG: RNA polymerase sigma factor [Planctomycetota bacterium]|nr:MAG: RNA polymerase sigma factor [Planctomycetota bacterium]
MSVTLLKSDNLDSFAERLEAFAERYAVEFTEESGSDRLLKHARRFREAPTHSERDAVSTALMEAYKASGSKEAFALLYELNHEDFLKLIYHHLRRAFYNVDAADILQEVFFNVYRYPFKFKPERATAFRNWTHSIIRNTVLKHSRRAQRDHVLSIGARDRNDEDSLILEPADERASSPLDTTAEREAAECLSQAWMLYLHVYLGAYRCLTPREKRVLYLVEVEGLPYREAAKKVEVRVENLKMMVFRARRKIHSIMKRKFQTCQSASDRRDLDRAQELEEGTEDLLLGKGRGLSGSGMTDKGSASSRSLVEGEG